MDHMVTTSVAERLTEEVKHAMSAQGVSQREMSKKTGIPLNTLNARLKAGTTRPFTVSELAQVLDVLNISLVELAVRAERGAVAA